MTLTPSDTKVHRTISKYMLDIYMWVHMNYNESLAWKNELKTSIYIYIVHLLAVY